MRDRVADVLAQRAALDRGAGVAVVLSLLLHGGLTAIALYMALHAKAPERATMVNIQFASAPRAASRPSRASTPPVAKAPAPKIEEPKPKIEEPKPVVDKTPPKPEKNTVPFSPFGKSTKKGSEAAAPAPPAATSTGTAEATSTAPDIAIGGSGVTGLEGGDFPYTLYIEGMIRRIGNNWFRPQQVRPGTQVIIYFRIQRDGTISEARVETPSGNGTFDRAALSAVRSSSPLAPLPFGFAGTYLGVHQTFR